MKTTILLALTMACAAAPAPAETLKKVPAALNPAKAYILVEYKLMPNPQRQSPRVPQDLAADQRPHLCAL